MKKKDLDLINNLSVINQNESYFYFWLSNLAECLRDVLQVLLRFFAHLRPKSGLPAKSSPWGNKRVRTENCSEFRLCNISHPFAIIYRSHLCMQRILRQNLGFLFYNERAATPISMSISVITGSVICSS